MINVDLINKMVSDGWINVYKHPNADLFIYNYSAKVQYDKMWNEATLAARGLILDDKMNIIARPFTKFFNLEELKPDELPLATFDVYDKMDGSLGILYWHKGNPYIATRGSFDSDQANHANKILYERYSETFDSLTPHKTYLFEIIYPDNRIVVDYKGFDDLVLLAVIDNRTGEDCPLPDIGFPVVKRYDGIKDIQQLQLIESENKEGFVIRFKNGMRVKMKFEEYVKLHRIVSGISNLAIWEYLKEGKSMDDLLEKIPDELYKWVQQTQGELTEQYNEVFNECKSVFKELDTRKETALYFQEQKYPSVLFSMLDNRKPDQIIWKMLRPKYSKAFRELVE